MFIDLNEVPEIQQLQRQYQELAAQVQELLAAQTDYVRQEEAQRITGLSYATLWRERNKVDSLIKWKYDHGVYYERASLHAHNQSRAVRRSRA